MADIRGLAALVFRDLANTTAIGTRKLLRQEMFAIADELEQEVFQTRSFRNVLMDTRRNIELLLSRQSKKCADRDDLTLIAEKLAELAQRHNEPGVD